MPSLSASQSTSQPAFPPPAASATATLPGDAVRLQIARETLGSADPFQREAGTQMLVGQDTPEALALLEKACQDQSPRVVEGALRALTQAVANGSRPAEVTLLRALATSVLPSQSLREAKTEQLGTLPADSFTARCLRFLAANPDLRNCRLRSLREGSAENVQAFRAARLRNNPAFTALFTVVRRDTDLAHYLKPMLARREEFRSRNGEPRSLEPFWPDIRRMTGLLAGIGTEDRLENLMQLVMDRTARRETETFWQILREDIPYVPEVIIGAGPHSANLCSAFATLRPHCLPLVIESRPRTGGPFAAPYREAWRMNSRVRPATEERRTMPGGENTLNSLGPYAPVQEADLTGQSYATQDRLALAARMSLFLSAYCLVETTYVERFPNNARTRARLSLPEELPHPEAAKARYLICLRNNRTGETGYLATNAVISAGGLGEAKSAFPDRASKAVIANEAERAARGEMPRYLRFNDLMACLSGKRNPFPLRGIRSVLVIGNGDSARVAVEALLGYGPTGVRSPQTLDRVREVLWIGQKARTRDEFLACERPRYHALATEFPRSVEAGRGNARIRPIAERAIKFTILAERAAVFTDKEKNYRADLVVDCSGFGGQVRGVPVPLDRWNGALLPGRKLRLCDSTGAAFTIVLTCESVTPSATNPRQKRYSGTVQEFSRRTELTLRLAFETIYCEPENLGGELEAAIRQRFGRSELPRLYLQPTVLPLVSGGVNDARAPFARKEREEQVFYIGPQAGLPEIKDKSEAEGGKSSGVYDSENAVALWRYAETVTAFAEYYLSRIAPRSEIQKSVLPTFAPEVLSKPSPTQSVRELSSVTGSIKVTEERQGALSDSERTFRCVVLEHLHRFHLPEEVGKKSDRSDAIGLKSAPIAVHLRFTPEVVSLASRETAEKRLHVQAEGRLLRRVDLTPLLIVLAEDEDIQRIILHWGFPALSSQRSAKTVTTTIALHVSGRRLDFRGAIERVVQARECA
jgi:hypothetical protein